MNREILLTRASVKVINLEKIKGHHTNNTNSINNNSKMDIGGKWESAQKVFDSDNIIRARKAKIISNRLSELRSLSHD
jgi:hypothetical protein